MKGKGEFNMRRAEIRKKQSKPSLEFQPGPEGRAYIKIHRPEHHEYRQGSALDLEALLRHVGASMNYLLITPHRGHRPADALSIRPTRIETDKVFHNIPNQIRAKLSSRRIVAYWLISHWTEPSTGVEGLLLDKIEYSWLITCYDESISGRAWSTLGAELAKEHSCGPFICFADGVSLLQSEDGTALWPIESELDVERTWASLARLRETSSDLRLHSQQDLEESPLEASPRIDVVRNPEDPIDPVPPTSPYAVRGPGQPMAYEFFAAEPHCISSSMMFSHLGISPGKWGQSVQASSPNEQHQRSSDKEDSDV
jgi:hypothetical protein